MQEAINLTRQFESSLPHLRLILHWHVLDSRVQVGHLRGCQHLFAACAKSTVRDVVVYGVVKEDWILWYDAQLSPETVQGHTPDVPIANQDTSHRRIVESVEQSNNSRLTGKYRSTITVQCIVKSDRLKGNVVVYSKLEGSITAYVHCVVLLLASLHCNIHCNTHPDPLAPTMASFFPAGALKHSPSRIVFSGV